MSNEPTRGDLRVWAIGKDGMDATRPLADEEFDRLALGEGYIPVSNVSHVAMQCVACGESWRWGRYLPDYDPRPECGTCGGTQWNLVISFEANDLDMGIVAGLYRRTYGGRR